MFVWTKHTHNHKLPYPFENFHINAVAGKTPVNASWKPNVESLTTLYFKPRSAKKVNQTEILVKSLYVPWFADGGCDDRVWSYTGEWKDNEQSELTIVSATHRNTRCSVRCLSFYYLEGIHSSLKWKHRQACISFHFFIMISSSRPSNIVYIGKLIHVSVFMKVANHIAAQQFSNA